MTVQCIAFDLDDTLWECHPVIQQAEQRFYNWLKRYYPKICQKYSESELITHRMDFMHAQQDHKHDLTYLRKHWMKALADEITYDHSWIDNGFEVFWLARNEVTFYDGTLEILENLTERYSLGVISNGNADVNHIGIGHLFDFVLSSENAGISKPEKGIFEQAIKLSKCTIDEMVYVGDDPKRDILGAQGAGIKAIWFNPRLKPWPRGKVPFAVIQHLSELEGSFKNIKKVGGCT